MKNWKMFPIWMCVCAFMLLFTSFSSSLAEEALPEIKAGDILCFGAPDDASGYDGKWVVLDPDHTNTGEDGIFLLSLNLVGSDKGETLLFREIGDVTVSFTDRGETYAQEHPGATNYQGSDIQQWCSAFPELFLSEAERLALIPTYKSDEAIGVPAPAEIPLPSTSTGVVEFDSADHILNGDTVFLMSAEEATSERYGFTENSARTAMFKGAASSYWLRSPHSPTFPLDVGFVFYFGAVLDYPVNAKSVYPMSTYARPACNLDQSKITQLEELSTTDNCIIWRVSFEGGEINERVYDLTIKAEDAQ